jgi:hypothetical protein
MTDDDRVERVAMAIARVRYDYEAGFQFEPLEQERKEARAALAAAEPRWQPIETAPRDGTTIDVWSSSNGRTPDVSWGDYWIPYWPGDDRSGKRHVGWRYRSHDDHDYYSAGEPTHWQPLQPPPGDKP